MTAHARTTDPETSHQAAASVTKIRESQLAVLANLRRLGPSTDETLVARYVGPTQSPSGIRSRRNELVERGLVRWAGGTARLASGRSARVWEVVA